MSLKKEIKLSIYLYIVIAIESLIFWAFSGHQLLPIISQHWLRFICSIGLLLLGIGLTKKVHLRVGMIPVALGCIGLLQILTVPATYLLPTTPIPPLDHMFIGFDHCIGINVIALQQWLNHYPNLAATTAVIYLSLLYFMVYTLIALPAYAPKAFFWLLHITMLSFGIGIVMAYLLPALGPFYGHHQYLGLYIHSQAQFVTQYFNVKAGGTQYSGADITLPSFHVLLSLIVTFSWWVATKNRWVLIGLLFWSIFTIFSTMGTGWHYATDVIASLLLFPTVIAIRWWLMRNIQVDTTDRSLYKQVSL